MAKRRSLCRGDFRTAKRRSGVWRGRGAGAALPGQPGRKPGGVPGIRGGNQGGRGEKRIRPGAASHTGAGSGQCAGAAGPGSGGKGGWPGQKAHRGGRFRGKIPQKGRPPGQKRRRRGGQPGRKAPESRVCQAKKAVFRAILSRGVTGLHALSRARTRTRGRRQARWRARFRACIGRNGQTGPKATKVCPVCRLFVAFCSPFVIWTFWARGVMNVSPRRARPPGRPKRKPFPERRSP